MIHVTDIEEILYQLDLVLEKRKVARGFALDACHQRISSYFCTLIDLLGYEEGSHIFFAHYNAIIPPEQTPQYQQLPADGMSYTCSVARHDHGGERVHHGRKWYSRTWNRY